MTHAYDLISMPADFWSRPEILDRLAERDVAALFRHIQKAARASQAQIGAAVGLSQAQVSEVMSGRRKITSIDVYARIVLGLGIDDDLPPLAWRPDLKG